MSLLFEASELCFSKRERERERELKYVKSKDLDKKGVLVGHTTYMNPRHLYVSREAGIILYTPRQTELPMDLVYWMVRMHR